MQNVKFGGIDVQTSVAKKDLVDYGEPTRTNAGSKVHQFGKSELLEEMHKTIVWQGVDIHGGFV